MFSFQTTTLYPYPLTFIWNFLFDCSIINVVDGHWSPISINSGVPLSSFLLPTLFLSIINDLTRTQCPSYSYTNDSTLHFSKSIAKQLFQHEWSYSQRGATDCLSSDLSMIFLTPQKLNFFMCLVLDAIFQTTILSSVITLIWPLDIEYSWGSIH